jgi:glycosyltransferase involved in cell wall biosynthesis
MVTQDRPQMILEATAAILAQSCPDWELIIKDGGKRAVGGALPKDARIFYEYAPDSSYAVNLNRAFAEASGEILNFQGDDDWMRPDALERVSASIGESMWLYGQIRFSESGHVAGGPWDYEAQQKVNRVPSPATFWRREAMKHAGLFDVNLLAADWDYTLRLGARWTPVFVPHVLVDYRQHAGQATCERAAEIALDGAEIRCRAATGYYA